VHFYWLQPALAAVLALFLCVLALWHAPQRYLNRIFALYALSLTSWNLDITALYLFSDYDRAFFWSDFFRYGMLFCPPTLYHLILVLTGRMGLANRLILAVAYEATVILCAANTQGALVQGLGKFDWGYYPIGKPLYNLFTFSALLSFGPALYQLVKGMILSQSARQRQQLKIVLFGFAIMLPLTLTNLLPVYGIHFYPLGNLGTVFLCGVLTYAIVKHRLLDIELIITKTTASVAALILWLTPLWLLTAEVQQQLYGFSDPRLLLFALAVILVSGLVFPWLLHATEAWVRRILWGQKYDSLQALSMFQKTVVQVLDQEKIIAGLREVLVDALQTESVAIYLLRPATGAYAEVHESGADFPPDDPFLQALGRQHEPVVREEAVLKETDPQAVRLAATLAEHGGEVCVPLRTQDRLRGFIFLGKKRNRDIFSSENLQLLSTLGTEVAVALENARLYDELRASQVMLARSDRLAAVGTLAAGIAHEIRNPLVAVQTFVQLLPERLNDPEFRTTFTQLTTSELERVSTLINDLLTFARPAPVTASAVQINDLAEQVVRLLAGQAKKKGVALATRLDPDLPPFTVDPEQIKQVFMNLMLNALQATSAGGAVTLATAPQRGPDGHAYCLIEIRDTGEGIPAKHKEEIFNPFFTTKTAGTGLGLFITHQIIKEHGGSIDVESTVGQGTRVLARLPVAGPPPRAGALNGTDPEEAKNGAPSHRVAFPALPPSATAHEKE